MSEKARTVIIVRPANGQSLEDSNSQSDIWIRLLVRIIEANTNHDTQDRVPAEVFVVDRQGLRALLTQGPELLILFTTREAVEEARVLQTAHSRHRFVVFSGDFGQKNVPLIPKQMVCSESMAMLVRSV